MSKRSRRRNRAAATPKASIYQAGQSGRRFLRWNAPTTYPNQNLGHLSTMRDRSRQAIRDDGYATGIERSLVTNLIGTGIKPLSKADDAKFKAEIEELFRAWTDESDADGCQDWYGQQQQAARSMVSAGEAFVRLRYRRPEDGLTVPLQVQVIEPEQCPHAYSVDLGNGNRVRAGIEFDAIGRRVAYYFYASRPGDPDDWRANDLRRVPAESVIHVFKPLRPGQLRGVPLLHAALVRLWDLDQFSDATLNRQKLSNMFVAFLKNMAPTDAGVSVLTGADQETYGNGGTDGGEKPVLGLEPGIFQELGPGEEVQFSDPPDLMTGYVDFVRNHLRAAGAAAGVPYEVFTSDLSQVNDRTVRVILDEFRRSVESEQHHTFAHQLCRPVWNAWMDQVFLSQAVVIPAAYLADPRPWRRVKWMPQGWKYIHPVQDVEAQQSAIRCGLKSRSQAAAELGEDAEVIDAEQAADNARADKFKLKYDSDGRFGGKSAAPPGEKKPAPQPGEKKPAPGKGDPAQQDENGDQNVEEP